jgi:hypothetical protein
MARLLKTPAAESAAPVSNRIRDLNDNLRRSFNSGRVFITRGIASLNEECVERILQAVRTHSQFSPDNDPHGEHDFGSFEIDDQKIFFKIDYYDKSLTWGSSDPADATITERVLTIMLASEY